MVPATTVNPPGRRYSPGTMAKNVPSTSRCQDGFPAPSGSHVWMSAPVSVTFCTFTVKGCPPGLAPGETISTGGSLNASSKTSGCHDSSEPSVDGRLNAPDERSTPAWAVGSRATANSAARLEVIRMIGVSK